MIDFLQQNSSLLNIVLTYLVIINVVAFFAFGIDKWKAKHAKWRISEATLLMLAVIGGSIGAWLGMKVWHHKTLHKKFRLGIPLILIIQIALLFLTSCKTKQVAEITELPQGQFAPEHSSTVFIVMYDRSIGKEPLLKAIKKYKAKIIYDYNITPGMALKKPDNKTLEETMQYFRKVKGVISVEYDHIYRLTDPVRPKQVDR
ncbi:MAG: DUF1294 domain-containing protein [Prevotella sp.]|nr:DUF1294 domain-containing protein [Prevotella sp.]